MRGGMIDRRFAQKQFNKKVSERTEKLILHFCFSPFFASPLSFCERKQAAVVAKKICSVRGDMMNHGFAPKTTIQLKNW